MFKFGYLVSNKGRLLQTIINSLNTIDLPFEIAVVLTSRENEAADRARKAGIPTVVVDFKKFTDRKKWDEAILMELNKFGVDGVMLNSSYLLGPTIISHYAERILNIHFSLLPLFAGSGAMDKSIASGMRFSGVTLHLADNTMDGGPIIIQAAIPLKPQVDKEMLGKRLFTLAVPMQHQVMSWLASGRIHNNSNGVLEITDAHYETNTFVPNLEPPFDRLPSATYNNVIDPDEIIRCYNSL